MGKLVGLFAVVTLALTACGGSEDGKPSATVTETVTVTATPSPSKIPTLSVQEVQDQTFYDSLVMRYPSLTSDVDTLVSGAKSMCKNLGRGKSFDAMVDYGTDVIGLSLEVAAGYVGASIATYCPEHLDVLED